MKPLKAWAILDLWEKRITHIHLGPRSEYGYRVDKRDDGLMWVRIEIREVKRRKK